MKKLDEMFVMVELLKNYGEDKKEVFKELTKKENTEMKKNGELLEKIEYKLRYNRFMYLVGNTLQFKEANDVIVEFKLNDGKLKLTHVVIPSMENEKNVLDTTFEEVLEFVKDEEVKNYLNQEFALEDLEEFYNNFMDFCEWLLENTTLIEIEKALKMNNKSYTIDGGIIHVDDLKLRAYHSLYDTNITLFVEDDKGNLFKTPVNNAFFDIQELLNLPITIEQLHMELEVFKYFQFLNSNETVISQLNTVFTHTDGVSKAKFGELEITLDLNENKFTLESEDVLEYDNFNDLLNILYILKEEKKI